MSGDRLALPAPDTDASLKPALPTRAITAHVPAGLPAEAAILVETYQRASKSDATVRAYRSDAEAFEACRCAR